MDIDSPMKYCSNCGQPISRRLIADDGAGHYLCSSCGMVHYQNPRTIVACIAFWHDRILLCRRAEEPAVGQWVLPSGFLECGETLQEGAARETLEETGVAVDPCKLELYSVVNMPAIHQIIVAFRTELASEPQPCAGPECLEVAFKAESDVIGLDLAWSKSMGNSAQRLFDEVRTGRFGIHVITKGSEHGEGFSSREYAILAVDTLE
jgi:ADP-ribose pyrophosphatase YjhB (NUDIX family)